MSRASQTWAVVRCELTWDFRKKRTYIVVSLFLFAALTFGYLVPVVVGKSIAAGQTQLGVVFGSKLWWAEVVFLVFNTFMSGLFPLLVGGFTSADSLA